MMYYLLVSIVFNFFIASWYDLSLEDELLRNEKLSEADRELIDKLVMKRAKPQILFRVAMFSKSSWKINERITKCLIVHFLNILNVFIAAVMLYTTTR